MTSQELFLQRILELGQTKQTVVVNESPFETAHLVDLSTVYWPDPYLKSSPTDYSRCYGAIVFSTRHPEQGRRYGGQFYEHYDEIEAAWDEILRDTVGVDFEVSLG